MCLKIPFALGRDLNDVAIFPRSGEEWVRVGSSVFRPADSVWPLAAGSSVLSIGTEGYAEWRSIPPSPGAQSIALSGATAWKLYDGEFNLKSSSDSARQPQLPAHAAPFYLLVYGKANSLVSTMLA